MNKVGYLFFDRIKIQGANAISSPLTYGFPAITGFLGAIHALSRKIPSDKGMHLDGVLIACHDCQLQTFRPHPYTDYTFNQTRNPLKKRNGNYQAPPIIEEGKANITISLLIEIKGTRDARRWLTDSRNQNNFENELKTRLMQQRLAGGSIFEINNTTYFNPSTDPGELKRCLLPAFVLIDAKSDLIAIMDDLKKSDPKATELDALIETATIHHIPEQDENEKISWQTENIKSGRGWLVPIPVGFQAIAPQFEKGALQSCRNPEYPSQYVESVYSLGKWVFPYRLGEDLEKCFWRYENQEHQFYLVTQTSR